MKKVIAVKYLTGYQLLIIFEEGIKKTIDFSPYISGSLGENLREISYFQEVTIESSGGLVWPNGYDFCPNYLFEIGKPVRGDVDIAA